MALSAHSVYFIYVYQKTGLFCVVMMECKFTKLQQQKTRDVLAFTCHVVILMCIVPERFQAYAIFFLPCS